MAFTTITGLQIGQSAISATYTTVALVGAGERLYVKDMDICNTTGAAITVFVHLVPFSIAVGTSNALLYGTSVAANDTLQWTGTQIMNEGDTIQVKGGTTGLTITVSGGSAV